MSSRHLRTLETGYAKLGSLLNCRGESEDPLNDPLKPTCAGWERLLEEEVDRFQLYVSTETLQQFQTWSSIRTEHTH